MREFAESLTPTNGKKLLFWGVVSSCSGVHPRWGRSQLLCYRKPGCRSKCRCATDLRANVCRFRSVSSTPAKPQPWIWKQECECLSLSFALVFQVPHALSAMSTQKSFIKLATCFWGRAYSGKKAIVHVHACQKNVAHTLQFGNYRGVKNFSLIFGFNCKWV